MSIKLLPASVDAVDPSQASDVSTSLVLLTQRAIATRAGQTGLAPSADRFAWSSSTRRRAANVIDATPVEEPDIEESDINEPDINETRLSDGEYVCAWSGSSSAERMAIAWYLFYIASPAAWSGRLINLYA
jgi:hypothetical protein